MSYKHKTYDPIKAGSIDGTDVIPHDNAVVRAVNFSFRPPKLSGKTENTLFVGRLSSKTDEDTLKKTFEEYGTVVRTTVIRESKMYYFDDCDQLEFKFSGDLITGHSKLYGFVEFKHKDQAQDAHKYLHRTLLDQSEIIVEFEAGRTMKGWKPRRLGGGFGGRKESGQLRFGGRERPFVKPIGGESKSRSSVSYKN
jgi:U11/U12 small nuclear ribonucleoprotein 35 kDa protein